MVAPGEVEPCDVPEKHVLGRPESNTAETCQWAVERHNCRIEGQRIAEFRYKI
jgi:hypothetical protein